MLLPGLATTALAVAFALVVNRLVPALSPAVVAVAAGALLANLGGAGPRLRPGLAFVARRVLRTAIVLLGLQIAVPQVLALGWPTVAVVVTATGLTFALTPLIGRRLGLPPGTSLLVATGVSICGAAAIAAMHDATRAPGRPVATDDATPSPGPGGRPVTTDDDAAAALGVVVLYGSAAIVAVPLVASWLGLSPAQLGVWAGAAVHEVAQVAAIGSASGVLATAITVKLGRVLLLAPIVALTTAAPAPASTPSPVSGGGAGAPGGVPSSPAGGSRGRPPVLPLFVAGFLVAVALRSLGLVPSPVTAFLPDVTTVLMAAALFALGTGIDARKLARGGRVLLLGGISTGLLAVVSLAGVALLP
ncbi:putative membrane protein YadS [Nonomuraea muscovyensis]|uniref:Putative membrane protein YadS n=1 Tax=Nonomuraea muscovyensis TaxID=1124761 RepID=A0A7X0F0U2_9ACTN|nr:putative sulfate exporter family transporter [Nonomuraea muscovyensis]MBB6348889.1 putative membrane protein YadS [Nonomuraea muscovyensis]